MGVRVRRGKLALALMGAGLLPGCAQARGVRAQPPAPGPQVFVEALPTRTAHELFGELRALDVEVELVEGRRLRVRMNDADNFQAAAELLADMGHELAFVDLAWLEIDDLGPLVHLRSAEGVDLRGMGAGSIVPLRHLTELRELSLAETDFESLGVLAELPRLERLDLSAARADLGAVGRLSGLRELDLTQARTEPRGFELRTGEGLDLAGLRELESLERLELVATKVRDWAPLRRLWSLHRLDLSYTNFQRLDLLVDFAELEDLRVRRTAVDDLWPLLQLGRLRRVDLRDCEFVDPADVDKLARLRPELEILY